LIGFGFFEPNLLLAGSDDRDIEAPIGGAEKDSGWTSALWIRGIVSWDRLSIVSIVWCL
jgi:hypothetical protein